MKIVEHFTLSAKGDMTEDLIVETPHFFGVFDGVSGVRKDWLRDGKTMGQWGSHLAGESLKELFADATAHDFACLATKKISEARTSFGLGPTDRVSSTALVLPRRRPLEIWSIGDSHHGYRLKNGDWHGRANGKLYDEVTLAYRGIIVSQEILDKGPPRTQEERGALAALSWESIRLALAKQTLLANHPDPQEPLGFGLLCGTPVPAHHIHVHALPDDVAEIVLCTDGLPEALPSADEAKILLAELRTADPFLLGKNRLKFRAHKGGFVQMDGTVADCYDDVAYLRVCTI